jgi:hypothetical protein
MMFGEYLKIDFPDLMVYANLFAPSRIVSFPTSVYGAKHFPFPVKPCSSVVLAIISDPTKLAAPRDHALAKLRPALSDFSFPSDARSPS